MFKIFISPLNKMNHFDEILREGQSLINHQYPQNQELYDKSTNQSNLMGVINEQMASPFDSSPKASMFFFSLNSPRQNTDNFHFNHLNPHSNKNTHQIPAINRRLQFEQDPSLFCQEEQIEQDEGSNKEFDRWGMQSSQCPTKTKKIKKCKNSKGLKNLSIGVYDIVAEKVQTTYKEVANCLIQKLSKKAKEEITEDSGYESLRKLQKDEHNIKRRVYDALNVLISAELLRKDGKKVICNCNLKQEHMTKQYLEGEKGKLEEEVRVREKIVGEKRGALQRLESQQGKLEMLLRKNKSIGPRPTNSIGLPFIAAQSVSDDIGGMQMTRDQVTIEFKSSIIIMGDVDTLYQLQ